MRKFKRILGQIIYDLVAKHLPASFSVVKIGQTQLRTLCAKLILTECGKNVNIEKGAVFSSKVHLGDNSGIGINASIAGTTYIGNDVMMGPDCTIYTQNHRIDDTTIAMREQGLTKEQPVYIGNDVWIGGNVTILPGVRVGDHAVLAACAVVTKDVPPWAIAAGNPAVVKKFRNQTDTKAQN